MRTRHCRQRMFAGSRFSNDIPAKGVIGEPPSHDSQRMPCLDAVERNFVVLRVRSEQLLGAPERLLIRLPRVGQSTQHAKNAAPVEQGDDHGALSKRFMGGNIQPGVGARDGLCG
jgi:hypothetical protein